MNFREMPAYVKFAISWCYGLENRGKAWYNIIKKNKRKRGYVCLRKDKGMAARNLAVASADLPHAQGGKNREKTNS